MFTICYTMYCVLNSYIHECTHIIVNDPSNKFTAERYTWCIIYSVTQTVEAHELNTHKARHT